MHPESRLGKGGLASKGYVSGTFPVLDSSCLFWKQFVIYMEDWKIFGFKVWFTPKIAKSIH